MVKFSQVFLKDENSAERIIFSLPILKENDILVEIGPGRGVLTKKIIKKYKNFLAIEIDIEMVNYLKKEILNINIINEDFLKINLEELFKQYENIYLVGNLPYKISTAIIEKILNFQKIKGAVFMFQKEVALKLLASPKNKDYGYLSTLVKPYFFIEKILDVPKEFFTPVPKVDSMIVKFTRVENIFSEYELKRYKKIISFSFMHKRKTILNSIFLSFQGKLKKEEIVSYLEKANISTSVRAEYLSFEDFINISKQFNNLLD